MNPNPIPAFAYSVQTGYSTLQGGRGNGAELLACQSPDSRTRMHWSPLISCFSQRKKRSAEEN